MCPTILVTGGAGFVGSHACKALHAAGFQPVAYDDLSNGHEWAVRWGPLERGALTDEARLSAVLAHYRPAAVIHFAAFIEAGQSVRDPLRFYANNVGATLSLLRCIQAVGIIPLVFSSTAAVYGDPQYTPIDEHHPKEPVNPYGRTKLVVEGMLADAAAAHGLRYTALRYFNAAGADPDGEIGEAHDPETHLIPLVLQAAAGTRADIAVFGTDYDTRDGTCIRDYVHVADLAQAHVLALRRLLDGGGPLAANLGNGAGFSVKEVIAAAEHVTGRTIPVRLAERRPGDPPVLVSDSRTARQVLGWHPLYGDLETQISHAWAWARRSTES